MPTVANATAHQPLQTLIDDLWQGERQQAEEQVASIEALEETMAVLEEWSQRLETQQTEQEESEKEEEARWIEAEEVRKRLEHDLVAARGRIADLQSSLQERTEELLKVQAANNDLADELQALSDAQPLCVPPAVEPVVERLPEEVAEEESSPDLPEAPEVESVSERFGRLRKKKD